MLNVRVTGAKPRHAEMARREILRSRWSLRMTTLTGSSFYFRADGNVFGERAKNGLAVSPG
jgi:hypothetical protein